MVIKTKYILRFDDASCYMDIDKWDKIEKLMDQYKIHPIVGIIPHNEDPKLTNLYHEDLQFWSKAQRWKNKCWCLALHGYNHRYLTDDAGINPINQKSEFAGVSLDIQKEKIRNGIEILGKYGIYPTVFFAPAHTFDKNTLRALKMESNIRVISDTIANDIYFKEGFYFIPQQMGHVCALPLKLITFCYHPNNMEITDFIKLETFIQRYKSNIISIENIQWKKRKFSIFDYLLKKIYFISRVIG